MADDDVPFTYTLNGDDVPPSDDLCPWGIVVYVKEKLPNGWKIISANLASKTFKDERGDWSEHSFTITVHNPGIGANDSLVVFAWFVVSYDSYDDITDIFERYYKEIETTPTISGTSADMRDQLRELFPGFTIT